MHRFLLLLVCCCLGMALCIQVSTVQGQVYQDEPPLLSPELYEPYDLSKTSAEQDTKNSRIKIAVKVTFAPDASIFRRCGAYTAQAILQTAATTSSDRLTMLLNSLRDRSVETQRPNRIVYEGHCPVSLLEEQRWTEGKPRLRIVLAGAEYRFATSGKFARFLLNPAAYMPVANGYDLVLLTDSGKRQLGDRRHGVYYRDRVYLFASERTLATFSRDPERYATGQIAKNDHNGAQLWQGVLTALASR